MVEPGIQSRRKPAQRRTASLRQRTIGVMVLRFSHRPPPICIFLPASLFPLKSCWIAADVISCFPLWISAFGLHVTVWLPAFFGSILTHYSLSLFMHACPSQSPLVTLTFCQNFTQILSSLFCHVPLIFSLHLSLSVFALLIVLLFSSLSCHCSEGWRMYLTKLS